LARHHHHGTGIEGERCCDAFVRRQIVRCRTTTHRDEFLADLTGEPIGFCLVVVRYGLDAPTWLGYVRVRTTVTDGDRGALNNLISCCHAKRLPHKVSGLFSDHDRGGVGVARYHGGHD
jgi:hypothetical protein